MTCDTRTRSRVRTAAATSCSRPIARLDSGRRQSAADDRLPIHRDPDADGQDGEGKGTLSYATKITARGNTIELENFASAPAMLDDIRAKAIRN